MENAPPPDVELADTAPPKRYKVLGARIHLRVPNSGLSSYGGKSAWMVIGLGRGAVLPPDVHPRDLEHLLTASQAGPYGGPMLELIQDPATSLCAIDGGREMPREVRGPSQPWRIDTDGRGRPIPTAPVQAAAATAEDVRRAYYDQPGAPMTYWITELQLDPLQLIVCDQASASIYRVPVTIKGTDISFGAPVPVEREYTDVPASKPAAAARWGAPVAATAAQPAAGRPGRDAEAKIAAAVADGKIPQSRAAHYRALAAAGDDLAVLDQLAAGMPGLGQGGADGDPGEAAYASLFGNGPPGRSQPLAAASASEDADYERLFSGKRDPGSAHPAYKALFPAPTKARAAVDAREAAAAKATAPLSDQELYDEMFGTGSK